MNLIEKIGSLEERVTKLEDAVTSPADRVNYNGSDHTRTFDEYPPQLTPLQGECLMVAHAQLRQKADTFTLTELCEEVLKVRGAMLQVASDAEKEELTNLWRSKAPPFNLLKPPFLCTSIKAWCTELCGLKVKWSSKKSAAFDAGEGRWSLEARKKLAKEAKKR